MLRGTRTQFRLPDTLQGISQEIDQIVGRKNPIRSLIADLTISSKLKKEVLSIASHLQSSSFRVAPLTKKKAFNVPWENRVLLSQETTLLSRELLDKTLEAVRSSKEALFSSPLFIEDRDLALSSDDQEKGEKRRREKGRRIDRQLRQSNPYPLEVSRQRLMRRQKLLKLTSFRGSV